MKKSVILKIPGIPQTNYLEVGSSLIADLGRGSFYKKIT